SPSRAVRRPSVRRLPNRPGALLPVVGLVVLRTPRGQRHHQVISQGVHVRLVQGSQLGQLLVHFRSSHGYKAGLSTAGPEINQNRTRQRALEQLGRPPLPLVEEPPRRLGRLSLGLPTKQFERRRWRTSPSVQQ